MFGVIVLAIDEHGHSERAMSVVASMARTSGDKVVVVHVRPLGSVSHSGYAAGEEDGAARSSVDAHVSVLAEQGVDAVGETTASDGGAVHEALLDVVAQHNAGLIVVGNRGHSETTSLLIGSVSHHVIQHARVPVLVVRDVDQAPGS